MFITALIALKLRSFLRKNFVRLAIFAVGVVSYGTISEFFLERGAQGSGVRTLFDSLWFVMQTIATVGYGDTPVVTFWGRINAIILMVVGVGVLAFFSASFASVLIDYSTHTRLGERLVRMKSHVVICNWNSIADQLLEELVKEGTGGVVLLAPLEKRPSDGIEFVRGTCLHQEDLKRANVQQAESVIILAETITDGEFASAIDAKTILGAMNVRRVSSDAHIVVELLKHDSLENAKSAGANEAVVRGEVSAKLLSRAALDPGTIDIVETILTSKSGEEIFEEPLPSWTTGKTWIELANYFLDRNATPIALRSSSGSLKINPPAATVVDRESKIVYISKTKIRS